MSPASDLVIDTGVLIARELAKRPRTRVALALNTGVSISTADRALTWLRRVCGAPLTYSRKRLVWVLNPNWRVPTEHLPDWALREELAAIVGDADPLDRLRELVALDAELRALACGSDPLDFVRQLQASTPHRPRNCRVA